MAGDKIVISFEDEASKHDDGKITTNLRNNFISEDNDLHHEPEFIPRQFSFYRGNPALNGFYDCNFSFPDQSDSCFRIKFTVSAGEGFLNSILEYEDNLVLSSLNGNVYFVDRNDGSIKNRIFFSGESFEKTGMVVKGYLFLNSLRKIYKITSIEDNSVIYENNDSYIWSNLNYSNGKISFLTFNPDTLESDLILMDIDNKASNVVRLPQKGESCGKIVVANENHYVMAGNTLFCVNNNGNIEFAIPLGFEVNDNTMFFSLRNHLYLNSPDNELYFMELHMSSGGARYSGIKTSGAMYAAAFDDNIFIGTGNGWSLYKLGGQCIYSFDDINESVTECLNRKLLVVLKKDKITFHNLARFHEADTFLIPAGGNIDVNDYFISSILSDYSAFALTRHGKLFAFSNDKMNIKV